MLFMYWKVREQRRLFPVPLDAVRQTSVEPDQRLKAVVLPPDVIMKLIEILKHLSSDPKPRKFFQGPNMQEANRARIDL